MVNETTFGVSVNIQDGENLSVLKCAANIMLTSGILIFQPWYQWKLLLRLTKYYNMIVKSRNEVTSFARMILDQKMGEYKNAMKNESNELDEVGRKRSNIFIDECIRLSIQEKCFTETDIILESLTIMGGGFETIALTVSYIILMLALYPKYQEKVFQEIHDILPDQSSDISADDISKLDYTNRFIKEVMRFIPIDPLLGRKAKEDLRIGKYTIPAGTEMAIPVFTLHRNPLVWGETANAFDPDHFLPEALVGKHPYSFLEYGGGVRICIGMKYAKIVTRLLVCWLVRNYRFTTDFKIEQLHFRMNITMKLLEKHMVHVHKRENY